jgi:hypothetical protein
MALATLDTITALIIVDLRLGETGSTLAIIDFLERTNARELA